jgi:uncharacterized protein (DUF608 family)
MADSDSSQPCPSSDCGCAGGLNRRQFVELLGMSTAAALAGGLPVMAGPFETADFARLIPADKKLDPAWVKSLFARGQREIYRGAELEKIGMPVGGICAGQLYLGGDGSLWHWDIFNQIIGTGDGNYAHPPNPDRPLNQGFAIRTKIGDKTEVRKLDRTGFADVTFCGEYPIGTVEYRDPKSPVSVSLEAFSPFIPLDPDNSSLPVTLMRFTVTNNGSERADVELGAWLENAVLLHSGVAGVGTRHNSVEVTPLRIDYTAEETTSDKHREPIVFDDFQKETYKGWTTTGTAFGKGPIPRSQVPAYQGDLGGPGARVVNSHACAPGKDVLERDSQTGTLTSREFKIERNFITFWIGGGNKPGKECVNLLVDGKPVRTATGRDANAMRREQFDVRELQGKMARLQIVDDFAGPWGNVGVAQIEFVDTVQVKFADAPDFGTLSLQVYPCTPSDRAVPRVDAKKLPESVFLGPLPGVEVDASEAIGRTLVGGLVHHFFPIGPNDKSTVTFIITWRFPNLRLKNGGRYYATRFKTSGEVAEYVTNNFSKLFEQTHLWHDTWYDSTLPYWFLNRTFLNTSILATSTCHWFADGRFYGWEGVGCCEGTCTHVWHYAHAVARLFPQLERDLRRRTDFGTAINLQTGVINHRGEGAGLAVDGQAGCILRAYREHQMSASPKFLRELWPRIKLAMRTLINMDEGDGLLRGPQHNTLDQPWFGKVAWLSSLYVAAARACEEMAHEMGDEAFEHEARKIIDRGSRSLDGQLFNGRYYVQLPDPQHVHSVGSFDGCEVDQAFGQSWAWQVGLGRILKPENVKTALQSLWTYNFTPDVGPYRKAHPPGRWYAMAGEAGLIMCTWPTGEAARTREGFDFYFNECMNGFEYQVAGHMLWEGMLTEGLAICRAIHDRYHPRRRNPWNEVECGDHYARSMASYGVFLAACGFEYHGPNAHFGFAPRLQPENFRAPFTAAEGWGTLEQKREGQVQTQRIELKHGTLRLRTLAFELAPGAKPTAVRVTVGDKEFESEHKLESGRLTITLALDLVLEVDHALAVKIA